MFCNEEQEYCTSHGKHFYAHVIVIKQIKREDILKLVFARHRKAGYYSSELILKVTV